MQLTTLFIATSALLLGSANAGCFSGGASWGGTAGKDSATENVKKICKGSIVGKYVHKETRVRCLTGYGDKTHKFTIHLLNDGPKEIKYDECVSGLQKEVSGCDHGGKTAYANWEYTSDPGSSNEGCPA